MRTARDLCRPDETKLDQADLRARRHLCISAVIHSALNICCACTGGIDLASTAGSLYAPVMPTHNAFHFDRIPAFQLCSRGIVANHYPNIVQQQLKESERMPTCGVSRVARQEVEFNL